MGWLRARLGENNTMMGAGLAYMVALQMFPGYAPLWHGLAAAVGIGGVATPSTANQK